MGEEEEYDGQPDTMQASLLQKGSEVLDEEVMMLSQSEEKLVAGLEQGEHYVKLIPNDYWEFYQEDLESFKKHVHGTKATKPSIVQPMDRTAHPLDLASLQNKAFSKLIPRDESNATIDF